MTQSAKTVTSGLVLRETETKETDKILTVLTPDLGKIALIARGARRKNSRIAAASQLLAYSELTLYKRGNWYILDEASTLELFTGVRQDFVLLSLASYFAELTDCLTEEGEDAREILPLLLNALYALGTLKKDPVQVKAAFEFRLLALGGFEPLCDGCAVCGRETPEAPMLDVVRGIVHCAKCKEPGGLSLPLTNDALAALRHILYGPAKKLYSFTLDAPQLRLLGHAAEAFVVTQLERGFRTLDYYKAILSDEGQY
ncbi:MAG: DNA repair protein RecO [Oscillospiraceae bacterium]|nr:DNA repair protein RecO [Oscillospiraceae bacterium]